MVGNVLKAGYGAAGEKPVSFVLTDDQTLYKALMGQAFEVQVRTLSVLMRRVFSVSLYLR